MDRLIAGRWVLLIAALIGAGTNIWLVGSPSTTTGPEFLLPLVAMLQAGGTYGFAKYLAARNVKGGWPVFVGYAAAVLWVVVLLSAMAGVAAGPGGLVYGILITLPALALAPLLQIAALWGFAGREKKASAAAN